MNKQAKCLVCGELTPNRFNINFDARPICEDCANKIFLQQAQWFVKEIEVGRAYDRISHIAVEKQIYGLIRDFTDRFYASDYYSDRDAEVKVFLKERGFMAIDQRQADKINENIFDE